MRTHRRVWIACAAVLALGTPAAAQAAPTWLAPTPLSGAQDYQLNAAMNAGGDTVLALRDTSVGTPYPASAAFRPAGGPTSAVAAVDPTATGTVVHPPDVAINSRGDAAVLWTDTVGVWLALRPAGSAGLSAPIPITSTAGGSPQVAIDDAGTVFLAWIATSGPNSLVFFAARAPSGTLGPIGSSAAGQNSSSPTIAAAPDGHAVVAWSRFDGTHTIIQAATRAPGATGFLPVGSLSDSAQSANAPDAAVADGGNAAIAWSRSDGTHPIVQVARRQDDGLFSTGLGISPTTVDSRYPAVAVNAAGQVVVSWTIEANEATARVGSVTGDFAPRIAFPTNGGGQTQAALNGDGVGLVTWVGYPDNIGYASIMPAGGAFGTPVKISPDGTTGFAVQNAHSTTASIDADGDAVAYVQASQGGVAKVYERLYDGAGPRLSGLSVPATATAGTSATFAVAPTDVISSVASTSWSFGDGSPVASGTSVQHTFAAAGGYDVTVTATDTVGNARSATRRVTVGAAPVTPPPTLPQTLPIPSAPKAPVKCKVPSLKNLSVARAKSKLVKANCKLGKVTTPRKLKHKKGLVVRSQSRKAGTSTINGTKVNVTLGAKPKPKKKVRGR